MRCFDLIHLFCFGGSMSFMAIIAWACRCIGRASHRSFQVLMTPTDWELS